MLWVARPLKRCHFSLLIKSTLLRGHTHKATSSLLSLVEVPSSWSHTPWVSAPRQADGGPALLCGCHKGAVMHQEAVASLSPGSGTSETQDTVVPSCCSRLCLSVGPDG